MYLAHLYLNKEVSDWDNEKGAGTQRTIIMEQSGLVEAPNVDQLKKEIQRWTEKWGLSFKEFGRFDEGDENESLGGRFSFNQIEDDEGDEDKNGNYLADYDLYVKVMKTERVPCPKFGLKDI